VTIAVDDPAELLAVMRKVLLSRMVLDFPEMTQVVLSIVAQSGSSGKELQEMIGAPLGFKTVGVTVKFWPNVTEVPAEF
jgi:hypothetical protein